MDKRIGELAATIQTVHAFIMKMKQNQENQHHWER